MQGNEQITKLKVNALIGRRSSLLERKFAVLHTRNPSDCDASELMKISHVLQTRSLRAGP
jgi:hypothetical protein